MYDNKEKTPQVLLLGNGINLAFGGTSWKGLIDKIKVREDIKAENLVNHKVPMPLQAILVTNNHIKEAMKDSKSSFYGTICNENQRKALQRILSMGFDDILTTNYSYELETSVISNKPISDYQLKKITRSTRDRPESQYLLHTYQSVEFKGKENRIWHIHGEARKPNSMILGHYWYSNQLSKLKAESDQKRNIYVRYQEENRFPLINSWFDSFVLGDVYILGFGFDFSEIDLWWLLNRKKRESAHHGKVYFYEMESKENYEKTELLRLFDVEIISMGMTFPKNNEKDSNSIFEKFYLRSLDDIEMKIKARRTL